MQPKIDKLYFIVKENIFKAKVHVFLNYSSVEFDEWCAKNRIGHSFDNNKDSSFAGYSMEIEGIKIPLAWAILVKHFNWTVGDQGTLIHEIIHTIIKAPLCF